MCIHTHSDPAHPAPQPTTWMILAPVSTTSANAYAHSRGHLPAANCCYNRSSALQRAPVAFQLPASASSMQSLADRIAQAIREPEAPTEPPQCSCRATCCGQGAEYRCTGDIRPGAARVALAGVSCALLLLLLVGSLTRRWTRLEIALRRSRAAAVRRWRRRAHEETLNARGAASFERRRISFERARVREKPVHTERPTTELHAGRLVAPGPRLSNTSTVTALPNKRLHDPDKHAGEKTDVQKRACDSNDTNTGGATTTSTSCTGTTCSGAITLDSPSTQETAESDFSHESTVTGIYFEQDETETGVDVEPALRSTEGYPSERMRREAENARSRSPVCRKNNTSLERRPRRRSRQGGHTTSDSRRRGLTDLDDGEERSFLEGVLDRLLMLSAFPALSR